MTTDATSAISTEVEEWIRGGALAAEEKQAQDIVVLEVGPVLGVAEYFLICDGGNERQVKAITKAVEDGVRSAGGPRPRAREGMEGREWVLLDFGDLIVHVFSAEARRFYDLERLWADVDRFDWR